MNALRLPIQALRLLLGSKALFFLAFLPGILTMALTAIALVSIWNVWLEELKWWISYPVMAVAFPFFWVIFGNLALAPIEDQIVDRVQLALWDQIKIPSRDFALARITQELGQSIFISVFFAFLLLFALVPGMAILSSIFGAWATSWNFLVTIYNRKHIARGDKLREFFGNIGANTLLGVFLNILLFVPILNVWLLGYALILATLVEMERHGNRIAANAGNN